VEEGGGADISLLKEIQTRSGAKSAPYSVGRGAPLWVKAAGS